MTTLSRFPLGKSINASIVLDSFEIRVQNRATQVSQIYYLSHNLVKVQYCTYQWSIMGDAYMLRELPFSAGNASGILFWLRDKQLCAYPFLMHYHNAETSQKSTVLPSAHSKYVQLPLR